MYGVDEATTDRLTDLAGMADQENIWEDFTDVLVPGFGLYLDLEQSAASIKTYDAELIHGLLQTRRYHEHLTIGEGMSEANRAGTPSYVTPDEKTPSPAPHRP